jgi:hypothetical protein
VAGIELKSNGVNKQKRCIKIVNERGNTRKIAKNNTIYDETKE